MELREEGVTWKLARTSCQLSALMGIGEVPGRVVIKCDQLVAKQIIMSWSIILEESSSVNPQNVRAGFFFSKCLALNPLDLTKEARRQACRHFFSLPAFLLRQSGSALCYCYYCWYHNKGDSFVLEGYSPLQNPTPGRLWHCLAAALISLFPGGL